MKTDKVNPAQNYQHLIKEKHEQEQANKEMIKGKNDQSYIVEKSEYDKKEAKENIQKRKNKFYIQIKVHRRGFEPLTTRFEAGYSIRLSYRC